jgi:predicted Zn-dependent peptidase
VGGMRLSPKPFEQAHVIMGFEGVSWRRPEFYPAQVFSGLFGGGMSSRLFQEVREKRGLCYSIYSSAWGLSDAGLLSVHAATGGDEVQQLLGVLRDELRRAANELPSDRELQRAKAQIKTGILMSYESSVSRAEQMARQLLAFDRLVATDDLIGRVEAVSGEAVRDVARRMLTGSPLSFAIVGAGPSGKEVSARAMEALSI